MIQVIQEMYVYITFSFTALSVRNFSLAVFVVLFFQSTDELVIFVV
jgi:hypothetical protein